MKEDVQHMGRKNSNKCISLRNLKALAIKKMILKATGDRRGRKRIRNEGKAREGEGKEGKERKKRKKEKYESEDTNQMSLHQSWYLEHYRTTLSIFRIKYFKYRII